MARVCEPCKFYDSTGEKDRCPACGGPLRFTLLAPAGQAAPPPERPNDYEPSPPPLRPAPPASGSSSFADLLGWGLRHRLLLSLVVVPILLLLTLAGGVNLGQPSLKDKYDRLRVGMDVDEVKDIMEPRTYNRRMPMRHSSMFDNLPDEGPCTLTWQENGATVTLEFQDGVLARKSQKGLQ